MLMDLLIQIDESRNLLLKYSHDLGCPELILFLIRLNEFKNSTNGQQELIFVSIINDFMLPDSIFELNLDYKQKHSIHGYNLNEFDIVENEVNKMITQNIIPTFNEFIKKEYKKKQPPQHMGLRRPSLLQ